jgi:hypothetical protein
MPLGYIANLSWQGLNSQRHYPLRSDAVTIDTTGSFTLPDSFLLALDIPVSSGLDVNPWQFFIQTIGVFGSGFQIVVGYQPASGPAVSVATASVPAATHVPGNTYPLGGIGNFTDTVGKVTIGELDEINQQPSGVFTFDTVGAPIEADCVRPIIRGVSGILVSTGTESSDLLYGDIELIADSNMQITTVIVEGQNPQIVFSAVQGEGLSQTCDCVGNETGQPIYRINGVPPTPAGDFTLLGNDCLQVTGIQNGLKLNDLCSQPCCGCAELEAITADLERFQSQEATLQAFVNSLSTSVQTMDLTILGSKLSDTGCGVCG